MTRKEILVSSLVTKPADLIPLSHLLRGYLDKGITEVQAVLEGRALNARNLADIVTLAFKTRIVPGDIYVDNSKIEERDQWFATQFGFTVLPLAYTRLHEGQVEAWIGPTLVLEEHPLARTGNKNAVMVTTESSLFAGSLSQNHVLPYEKTTAAHYLRMTVKDDPGVLAGITREFADRNINIRGVLQPKAEEGSEVTDIAFILSPCKTGVLQSALASIGASENILKTRAVFRVLL